MLPGKRGVVLAQMRAIAVQPGLQGGGCCGDPCAPRHPHLRRPALTRALAALGAQWRQQPDFTAALLSSLLADMLRLASKAGAAAQAGGDAAAEAGSSLRQVLALAACVPPLLDAAAATRLSACQKHLEQLLGTFRQAVLAAAAAGSAAAAPAAVAAELAGHAARLAVLAPAAATVAATTAAEAAAGAAVPAVDVQQAGAPEPRVAVQLVAASLAGLSLQEERVQLKLAITADGPCSPRGSRAVAAPAAAGLQQSFAAVAAFAAAAAEQAAVLAQPAAVLALLVALRSWLLMLQAQAVPLDDAAALLLPAGSQARSLASSGSGSSSGWLLSLRTYSSKEVLLQAAQVLLPLVQHASVALASLLADTAQLASEQQVTDEAAALRFNLCLMHAAVAHLPPAQLASVWQQLLPVAQQHVDGTRLQAAASEGEQQRGSEAWLQLLQLLLATHQQLAAGGGAEADGVAVEALCLLTALLASSQLTSSEPATLLALQWLQQAAGWQLPEAGAAAAGSSTASVSDCHVAAAMQAALACTTAGPAAVRAAALAALHALAGSRHGSSVLLIDPSAAAALFQAALLHLADLDPVAAAAAQQLLTAAAAPLALSSCLATAGGSAWAPSEAAAEAAAVALQPQQLGFKPAQLQQLLEYVAGSEGPAAVLTSAGHQAAPAPALQQWLPRLLHTMRAVPPPAGGSAEPVLAPWYECIAGGHAGKVRCTCTPCHIAGRH